jgi:hypothetical protein
MSLLPVSSSYKEPKVSEDTKSGEGRADRTLPCSKIRLLVIDWNDESRAKELLWSLEIAI